MAPRNARKTQKPVPAPKKKPQPKKPASRRVRAQRPKVIVDDPRVRDVSPFVSDGDVHAFRTLYESATGRGQGCVNVTGEALRIVKRTKVTSLAVPPTPAGTDAATLISLNPTLGRQSVMVKSLVEADDVFPITNGEVIGADVMTSQGGTPLLGTQPGGGPLYGENINSQWTYVTAPLLYTDSLGEAFELDAVRIPNSGAAVGWAMDMTDEFTLTSKITTKTNIPRDTVMRYVELDADGKSNYSYSSVVASGNDNFIECNLADRTMGANVVYSSIVLILPEGYNPSHLKCASANVSFTATSNGDVNIKTTVQHIGLDNTDVEALRGLSDNPQACFLGAVLWVVGKPTMDQRGQINAGLLRRELDGGAQFLSRADMTAKCSDTDRRQAGVKEGLIACVKPRSRKQYGELRPIGELDPSWDSAYMSLSTGGTSDMHVIVQYSFVYGIRTTNPWLPKPFGCDYSVLAVEQFFTFTAQWPSIFENHSHLDEMKKSFVRAISHVPGIARRIASFANSTARIAGGISAVL